MDDSANHDDVWLSGVVYNQVLDKWNSAVASLEDLAAAGGATLPGLRDACLAKSLRREAALVDALIAQVDSARTTLLEAMQHLIDSANRP